jgi:hypothetical protein
MRAIASDQGATARVYGGRWYGPLLCWQPQRGFERRVTALRTRRFHGRRQSLENDNTIRRLGNEVPACFPDHHWAVGHDAAKRPLICASLPIREERLFARRMLKNQNHQL